MIKRNPRLTKVSRPVMVLGAQRSGGTLLMKCLASHPEVFAVLDEPLNPGSQFRKLKNDPKAIADVLLHRGHYDVSVLRITYDLFGPSMQQYMKNRKIHVVHIIRENVLRNQLSLTINHLARIGKTKRAPHVYQSSVQVEKVRVDPHLFVKKAMKLSDRQTQIIGLLAEWKNKITTVYYHNLVGREGLSVRMLPERESVFLCDRLNIIPVNMHPIGLHRVNNFPMSALIENWLEVKSHIQNSSLAPFLEDEKPWKQIDGKWSFLPDD